MVIKKAVFTDDVYEQLIRLSKIWEEENCTFGLRANTREDIQETCFLAVEGERIIGYTFGHFYEKETMNSVIAVGTKCFDIDEIYVLPEYRSKGIGKMLFDAIEKEVSPLVEFITLVTSTKDSRRILDFYIEDAGMTFYNAYLFKKTK